ncbi:MAG: hypothetical protein IBX60_07830 [Candidatus Aminicenantes bacterium]|nr:hypothetical protein [Candidatus Aminicenantes bacterium]
MSSDTSLPPGKRQWVVFDEIHKYPKWKNILKGYEETAQKYPVVCMLDGYEIFGLQLQTYQQSAFFETVPPLILVGINCGFKGIGAQNDGSDMDQKRR